ncbi:ECF transporter S component [Arsenicicoccus dermatophilus]|uniref:ECF transporter S component n=1 Tax=Arsenicicoccus dermatophilus TaxID=1076331 RepID=UPI0039170DBD
MATTTRPTDATGTRSPWSVLARRPLLGWRGIDLVVGAVLAVAMGVAFWAWDNSLYHLVEGPAAAYAPIGSLVLGVWLLPAVAGALLVRRPGAALYVELIAATVETLLGNKWAALVMLSALLQGLGVELAMAVWRWRRFDLTAAVLGGVLAAVLEICCYEWWAYVPQLAPVHKLVYLAFGVISGAVIAGLGAVALVRALARSGAVDAFPPAQEAREARRAA